MNMITDQMKFWSEDFGKEYTERNPQSVAEMNSLFMERLGVTRTSLNEEFVGGLDRTIKILDVGCNVGGQLLCLQEMGFTNLYGIELQHYAVELAKQKTKHINIMQGSAFDLPFKDGYFDLVYTSGVLIHLHPEDIGAAMSEIFRCAETYIWGYEYFNESYTMIPYRGGENTMWKGDFAKLYTDKYPSLSVVKEKRLKYLNDDNVDSMFLLKK